MPSVAQVSYVVPASQYHLKFAKYLYVRTRQVPDPDAPSSGTHVGCFLPVQQYDEMPCTATSGDLGAVKSNNDSVQLSTTPNIYET